MASDEHTCGLGKTFRGRFRHLDHYGQPFLQERRDISGTSQEHDSVKRVALDNVSYTETAKMAEEMYRMDIDDSEIKIKPELWDDYNGMFSLEDKSTKSIKVKVEPNVEEDEEL